MLNPDPKMDKNQIVALILCLLVLVAYPFILKKFSPATTNQLTQETIVPRAFEAQEAGKINPSTGELALSSQNAFEKIKPLPQAKVFSFENDVYEAEFTTKGAKLTKLLYKGNDQFKNQIRMSLVDQDADGVGLFGLKFLHDDIDLSNVVFEVKSEMGDKVSFYFNKPGQYEITKTFILSGTDSIIGLDVLLKNTSGYEKHFPMVISYSLEDKDLNKANQVYFEAIAWTEKAISSKAGKVKKKGMHISEGVEWAGFAKKYFTLLVKPEGKAIALDVTGNDHYMAAELTMEPLTLASDQEIKKEFFIYAGPQRYEFLKSFGVGFENILSRGFFGALKIGVLKALKFSHQYTHNFGWDILILTLLIKLLFAPLTHMSYNSMEKMKQLQPKQKALQDKHKSDPQKLNKEMMELYKKHKVNPMGGCLPMLLQIPVFIAFYQVLGETIELRGAPFIGWITDLSQPDSLFRFSTDIFLIGNSFNLLPLLMMASMVIQQKMTPQSGMASEQQKMMALMPIFFGFIFYKMPSGLVLYWFTSNILSILQQMYVRSKHTAPPPEPEVE